MIAPPPWTLTGDGLILIAHFPEPFVRAQGFLAPYQQTAYRGWIGTVMLVDYKTSAVGPYRELLFIPGLFRFGDTTSFSISKIYVSSEDSVWNGRQNWGIPKEFADFSFETNADGSRSITVSQNGQSFLSLRAKPWGPRFPITTKLMPGFRVMQERLDRPGYEPPGLLLTRPSASGAARLSTLSGVETDIRFFPDLSQIKPLAVLSVENFRMTFPVPEAR
ncbi:acetoacetate decarboxylase family protein [Spirosoma montaniterrae]|uniref:Acetoacetate decarboxylase n=1 Tax=Spirosoma montaniterrae TaxID=1178516 RepID=A0A1P9WWK0_9BACT|nr:acetoacetate decarboxylase family protein [Spirosoma montaniterrae]AQG79710.1 hypothetical protein AWR27_10445 [Spirosoma montaniterrae]